jgi:hypothetical protein
MLSLQGSRIAARLRKTGGAGGAGLEYLTPLEERVLAIMGEAAYQGI